MLIYKLLNIGILGIVFLFGEKICDYIYLKKTYPLIEKLLIGVYVLLVLSVTVFREKSFKIPQKILIPFKSYVSLITTHWHGDGLYIAMALFGNIILFVPLGILLSKVIKKNNVRIVMLVGFLCSLMIETYQYFSLIGTFEVDDLIQNTWGACIGCCLGNIVNEIYNKGEIIIKAVKNMYPIICFIIMFSICCFLSMLHK